MKNAESIIVKVDSTFKVGSRAKYALVYDESDYLIKVAAANVDRLAVCQPFRPISISEGATFCRDHFLVWIPRSLIFVWVD